MATIEDLLSDLKRIPELVQDGVDRAMLGDTFDVVQINKDQLLSGIDAAGKELGQYAPSTKKVRQRKGLQTDHIDLKFTGASQDSLGISKLNDSKFEMPANPRWDQKRFPEAIGFTKENEDKVSEIVIVNIEANLNPVLT
jgi:hypothetical protein